MWMAVVADTGASLIVIANAAAAERVNFRPLATAGWQSAKCKRKVQKRTEPCTVRFPSPSRPPFRGLAGFGHSSSMIFEKASSGCAPTRIRPLMKKVGVPVMPSRVPSTLLVWTGVLYFPDVRHASNAGTSSPTVLAKPASVAGKASASFWNTRSWNSQNLPCSVAQRAASAAARACGCSVSMGKSRKTILILPSYFARTWSSTGCTRRQ